MYNYNKNAAYDISVFEKKRVTKKNVVKFPKKKAQKNRYKAKLLFSLFAFLSFSVCLSAVAFYINGRVQLTKLNEEISKISKELTEEESRYNQLALTESSLKWQKNIEEKAKMLGLEKTNLNQIEYIHLPNKDKTALV